MTLEEVMDIVEDEIDQPVTPETKLDTLGMDSLEFLALLTRLNIPDIAVVHLDTVRNLHEALLVVQ